MPPRSWTSLRVFGVRLHSSNVVLYCSRECAACRLWTGEYKGPKQLKVVLVFDHICWPFDLKALAGFIIIALTAAVAVSTSPWRRRTATWAWVTVAAAKVTSLAIPALTDLVLAVASAVLTCFRAVWAFVSWLDAAVSAASCAGSILGLNT